MMLCGMIRTQPSMNGVIVNFGGISFVILFQLIVKLIDDVAIKPRPIFQIDQRVDVLGVGLGRRCRCSGFSLGCCRRCGLDLFLE